ncbi:unnamed protein product [Dicrocoelium dendriticum]|nr:unnamed protein product [Dicrocoelium dendriticum]CAH8523422.1 unnamed protein product [Dicrocoelium dendriticum]
MERGSCDLDAQLLEQFYSLVTSDRDALVNQLRSVIGSGISSESCSFFLDLSGWNLQRAIGAYFDFGLDAAASSSTNFTTPPDGPTSHTFSNSIDFDYTPCPPLPFDLRILSAHATIECDVAFKLIVENRGSATWCNGSYLRSEANPSVAKLASVDHVSNAVVWLPIGADCRIPLPCVPPDNSAELVIQICPLDSTIASSWVGPVTGALSFCLPSDEVFGETLYCTATPDPVNGRWAFQLGTPDNDVSKDVDTPMDET